VFFFIFGSVRRFSYRASEIGERVQSVEVSFIPVVKIFQEGHISVLLARKLKV